MKKSIGALIICLVMCVNVFMPVTITAAKLGSTTITSQGACVMDFQTGEVLYEYNGYVRRVPASMTKIMNMYCIYEALSKGEITLDTVVPISKNVYDKSRNRVYQSVLPLNYDTKYTVNEMMDVIVVYSASGAAVAMAELIGGSEAAYVQRMNETAAKMGIDAWYYDSCGIAENKISPVSMATLARNIIKDYPDILQRSSKKSVYFHGKTYKTTNHLLDTYAYQGADGLKTGTTSAAGYCFCGTAVRNGRRMISVTMQSSSTGQRFVDTQRLLDYGFANARELPEEAMANNGLAIPTMLPDGNVITSASAIIMDYETGEELYGHKADVQKPVASIAKMMSVYVIMDAIKNGEITLETVVPISENVYNLSRNENYKMMVNLHYDEVYTVDEMLDMIVIFSSAACVTAVAETLCGSEAAFVERMNQKAAEIGIYSVFYNGTGVCLNPEVDKENLMSAREVAMMTRSMIARYPEVLERTKCSSVEFHGATYYNLNKLFTDYYYYGADGFKNGMTDASGYCMCGTAEVFGKRVITVTLPSATNEARFTDSIKMFNYGLGVLGIDTTYLTDRPDEGMKVKDINAVKVNIDGNYEMNFTKPLVAENSTILVPVRELMEILNKMVTWNNAERTVSVTEGDLKAVLTPGSANMKLITTNNVDGSTFESTITLKAPCKLIGDTAYAPVEAVEAFGAAVVWEEDTQTVVIIAGVC